MVVANAHCALKRWSRLLSGRGGRIQSSKSKAALYKTVVVSVALQASQPTNELLSLFGFGDPQCSLVILTSKPKTVNVKPSNPTSLTST